ncbi:hypothetical protein EW146_g6946 [Bondarzewia mesenterica]|uniref:Uncharacterized protein n=1 Tax=Bondarzewia mesenterica TaxID=1095465 RepID=A0A4S4LM57_9AGAM|nr:hypothetical protein EW146_g6946 [Bondarzewia mesenterica]
MSLSVRKSYLLDKSAVDADVSLILSIAGGVAGSLLGGVGLQKTGKYHAYTIATYVCMAICATTITLATGVGSFILGNENRLVSLSVRSTLFQDTLRKLRLCHANGSMSLGFLMGDEISESAFRISIDSVEGGVSAPVLNTMNLLWALNFKRAVDPVTKAVIPVDIKDYSRGITTAPNPFKCDIVVRSESHAGVIRRNFAAAQPVV